MSNTKEQPKFTVETGAPPVRAKRPKTKRANSRAKSAIRLAIEALKLGEYLLVKDPTKTEANTARQTAYTVGRELGRPMGTLLVEGGLSVFVKPAKPAEQDA